MPPNWGAFPPSGGFDAGSALFPGMPVILPEQTILAGATLNWDIDLTNLPRNAAALVSFAWVAFGLGAAPGMNVAINGLMLAYRTNSGVLRTDLSTATFANATISADPLGSGNDSSIVGNNILRLLIPGGAGNDTRIQGRAVISHVGTTGVPIP